MKTKMKMRLRLAPALLLAALIALMLPQKASALGTASNITISNTASVDYTVGAVTTTIESGPGAGNTTVGAGNGTPTTFLVDDKVNVTVTANDVGQVTTFAGSSAQALKFTVENTGNTVHDFALFAIADPNNSVNVPPVSVLIYMDGGDGVYDGVDDVLAPFIDGMPVDTPQVVWIVATVPATAIDGDAYNFALKAEAHASVGAGLGALSAETRVGLSDDPAAVDVVFADGDGDGADLTTNDASNNGFYAVWGSNVLPAGVTPTGGFLVSGAVFTVAKTSAVIADPILGVSVNAKAIPGATVEYTITIANSGTATATSVNVTDTIDANTTGVYNAYGAGPDGVTVNFNGGGALAGTSAPDGVDASGYDSSFAAGSISVSGITLAAGQNAVIKYQVTIN